MAYTVNEYRVQVRGGLALGEIFVNTWTVLDVTGGQDVNEIADIIHGFYADVYGDARVAPDTSASSATAKNLSTGALTELDWEGISGTDGGDPLPTQLAVRVSLHGAGGVNGGPFIAGFTENAIANDSLVNPIDVSAVADALTAMMAGLDTAGWLLRIDRPTIESTATITQAKVGNRWDVIRKRAGDIAEGYTMATLP